MRQQNLSQTKNAFAQRLQRRIALGNRENAITRYSTHPIEELQGAIGNRAVNQLLANQPVVQAKPMFRGLSGELAIQPKLVIGAVGYKYEQEADRVAEQVVNQIQTPPTSSVQREEILDKNDELPIRQIVQRKILSVEAPDIQMLPLETAITIEEEASIIAYTKNKFKQINLALRYGNANPMIQEDIDHISSGLQKLRSYTGGPVYRGTTLPVEKQQQYEQKDAVVTDEAFWSTSKGNAYSTEPHQFQIDGIRTGVDISHLSGSPEGEVLFPAATPMKVVKVETPNAFKRFFGSNKWMVNLVQAKLER